jgi:hypothetical protein
MPDPGLERRRLSHSLTLLYRIILPVGFGTFVIGLGLRLWRDAAGGAPWQPLLLIFSVLLSVLAYLVWSGRRISYVWLVGDALEVIGPVSVRLPLARIAKMRQSSLGRGTPLFILRVDPPIDGRIETIRFIPRTDSWHTGKARGVWKDLQTAIDAAGGAQASRSR